MRLVLRRLTRAARAAAQVRADALESMKALADDIEEYANASGEVRRQVARGGQKWWRCGADAARATAPGASLRAARGAELSTRHGRGTGGVLRRDAR